MKKLFIFEGLAFFPGAIFVHKIDPISQWGMGRAQNPINNSGPGIGKVLVDQHYEASRGRIVVASQLEPETIRLVLHLAAVGEANRNQDKRKQVDEKKDQRE